MKKGFTLAEVLITLAIIGVVAALTIPVVVHKYQKHVYYTAFMKGYNSLFNAYQLSVAENGSPNNWNWNLADDVLFDTYMGKYLKIAKKCDKNHRTECGYDGGHKPLWVSDDDNETLTGLIAAAEAGDYTYYLLTDGTSLEVNTQQGIDFINGLDINSAQYKQLLIKFDTNGIKNPNEYGVDTFEVEIYRLSGNYRFGFSANDNYSLDRINGGINPGDCGLLCEQVPILGLVTAANGNCSPKDKTSSGLGCGRRMILEGKMNYDF